MKAQEASYPASSSNLLSSFSLLLPYLYLAAQASCTSCIQVVLTRMVHISCSVVEGVGEMVEME